ncbi:dihydrodipicolinate synthase family protein [Edaphobacter flagellatus]|uniref:dihydrodipicolinate synthase family protein n=1 Tax=Edaphobacter flagellatus TaxID=1933044 RepID=UPI0021B35214|nr:dihydrodipicolinate synthase family protein [Edaphobacter flagellatus]
MTKYYGVYAALLTSRDAEGDLDLTNYRRQFNMPAEELLSGYAINGATGEFLICAPDELAVMVSTARSAAPSKQLIVGIGASNVRGAVLRGKIAKDNGADTLLLPMPSFFPYRQDDLRAFVLAVADAVSLPILLYNLPQFTTRLDVDTAIALLKAHENIVGIKDSSGMLDIMRAITEAKLGVARIIGNDDALCKALELGLCDGVVSGVACTLPELITRLFINGPASESFAPDRLLLDQFIAQLSLLPTPWGLKAASHVRGFSDASYPFPLSSERQIEIAALEKWFCGWMHSVIKE